MTKLSVNINKIAVVRNSRGGNLPDVVRAALDIERFGAEGITVHPRPDARHIRYDDVRDLKRALTTELNIEGNPIPGFIDLVLEGVITLEKLVALMSVNPRRIFALEGGVEEGDAADFTVLDLGAEYAVDPGMFLSKGRATPFAGWKVQGRAVLTVVGGKEVYDDNYESNR